MKLLKILRACKAGEQVLAEGDVRWVQNRKAFPLLFGRDAVEVTDPAEAARYPYSDLAPAKKRAAKESA